MKNWRIILFLTLNLQQMKSQGWISMCANQWSSEPAGWDMGLSASMACYVSSPQLGEIRRKKFTSNWGDKKVWETKESYVLPCYAMLCREHCSVSSVLDTLDLNAVLLHIKFFFLLAECQHTIFNHTLPAGGITQKGLKFTESEGDVNQTVTDTFLREELIRHNKHSCVGVPSVWGPLSSPLLYCKSLLLSSTQWL